MRSGKRIRLTLLSYYRAYAPKCQGKFCGIFAQIFFGNAAAFVPPFLLCNGLRSSVRRVVFRRFFRSRAQSAGAISFGSRKRSRGIPDAPPPSFAGTSLSAPLFVFRRQRDFLLPALRRCKRRSPESDGQIAGCWMSLADFRPFWGIEASCNTKMRGTACPEKPRERRFLLPAVSGRLLPASDPHSFGYGS